jgi:hypothetical protein
MSFDPDRTIRISVGIGWEPGVQIELDPLVMTNSTEESLGRVLRAAAREAGVKANEAARAREIAEETA